MSLPKPEQVSSSPEEMKEENCEDGLTTGGTDYDFDMNTGHNSYNATSYQSSLRMRSGEFIEKQEYGGKVMQAKKKK